MVLKEEYTETRHKKVDVVYDALTQRKIAVGQFFWLIKKHDMMSSASDIVQEHPILFNIGKDDYRVFEVDVYESDEEKPPERQKISIGGRSLLDVRLHQSFWF